MGVFVMTSKQKRKVDLVKPEQVMYIRADGQGKISVPVPPEEQQEVAEAVFLLLQQNPLLSQGTVLRKCLVRFSQMMQDNPRLGEFLRADD